MEVEGGLTGLGLGILRYWDETALPEIGGMERKAMAFDDPKRAQTRLMVSALLVAIFTAVCTVFYLKYIIVAQQVTNAAVAEMTDLPWSTTVTPLVKVLLLTGAALGVSVLGFILIFWYLAAKAEKCQEIEREREVRRLRRRYD